MPVLPPTSPELEDASAKPYFLWWTDATVADLRCALRDPDPDRRAYWMGALLREANTRDVWLFVTPAEIRDACHGFAVTSGAPGRCGPLCCRSTIRDGRPGRRPRHGESQ